MVKKKKLTRTLSGVAPIAVMMKPHPCPHGRCVYCPALNSPNSYTEKSPPVLRAMRHNYDPYRQVLARLETYRILGHAASKCELIVMGGTFFGYPRDYRVNFVKSCFNALNGRIAKSLEEAHLLNERAGHRCVALTVETRPDCCGESEINELLCLGCTRVEIGVQTLDEGVYERVNRGHGIGHVIRATQLLKDSAYKVYYHFMPGLFSTPKKDAKMFKELFTRQEFMPDGLKIYPTVVVKGSLLEEMYKRGEFKPYGDEEVVNVLVELKKIVPKWVRIARVMRAFSMEHIVAGAKRNDLRGIAKRKLEEAGRRCRCIRCREAGYRIREGAKVERAELCREDYKASGGKEVFLSFEDRDNDVLIALLRLRLPYKPFRKEISESTALVREIHVYGSEVEIGKRSNEKFAFQHRGYGRKLMEEAERIAGEEWGCDKILVISGVGAREYFYRLGYRKEGPYVSKKL